MKGTSQVLLRRGNPFLSYRRFSGFGADRVAGLMLCALMASGPQKAAGLPVPLGSPLSGGSHVEGGAAGLGALCRSPFPVLIPESHLWMGCEGHLVPQSWGVTAERKLRGHCAHLLHFGHEETEDQRGDKAAQGCTAN